MRKRTVTIALITIFVAWGALPAQAAHRRTTIDRAVQDGWSEGWCPLGVDEYLSFEADGAQALITISSNGVEEQRVDNVFVIEEGALGLYLRDDPACFRALIYDMAASQPPEVLYEIFHIDANGWGLENAYFGDGSAPPLPFDDTEEYGGAVHLGAFGKARLLVPGLVPGRRYVAGFWWYGHEEDTLDLDVDTLDPKALYLADGRFKVSASWRTQSGATGQATAVSLTDDTGLLWFFNPRNVELVVKVLKGCPVNHHFWVFAGGLTNVHVDLDVTDTLSGGTRHYTNSQGTAFQPIQDTAAFNCP